MMYYLLDIDDIGSSREGPPAAQPGIRKGLVDCGRTERPADGSLQVHDAQKSRAIKAKERGTEGSVGDST